MRNAVSPMSPATAAVYCPGAPDSLFPSTNTLEQQRIVSIVKMFENVTVRVRIKGFRVFRVLEHGF